MSGGECIHGLGPVSACVICNGRAAAEAKAERGELDPIGSLFPSRYQSLCNWCRDDIDVGDLIHRTTVGTYVCEECAR